MWGGIQWIQLCTPVHRMVKVRKCRVPPTKILGILNMYCQEEIEKGTAEWIDGSNAELGKGGSVDLPPGQSQSHILP